MLHVQREAQNHFSPDRKSESLTATVEQAGSYILELDVHLHTQCRGLPVRLIVQDAIATTLNHCPQALGTGTTKGVIT